jgi:tRNA(Leu) C34 or U34 (ribose-2'-O)-methylase TrmL
MPDFPKNTKITGKGEPVGIYTVPLEGQHRGADVAVVLCDPLYAKNAASAMRTCAAYGVTQLWWTGERLSLELKDRGRWPREERMKGYKSVHLFQHERPLDFFEKGIVPVAIELDPTATSLLHFQHPDRAVYVFGPEDGSIYHPILRLCHWRVQIPTRHCLNLGQAISTVLWDRHYKRWLAGLEQEIPPREALAEDRGYQ